MKTSRPFTVAGNTLVLGAWLLASSGCDNPEPPKAVPTLPPAKSEPAKTAPAEGDEDGEGPEDRP